MRTKTWFLAAVVAFALAGLATASEKAERRASVLRAQAAELRMEAEALRDAKGNNPGKAKALDLKADALYKQADSIDDQSWPPGD